MGDQQEPPPEDRPPVSGPWREPIPDGLGQYPAGAPLRRSGPSNADFIPPSADYVPAPKAPTPPLPKAPKLSRRMRNHQRPMNPTWEPDPLSAYGMPQYQPPPPPQNHPQENYPQNYPPEGYPPGDYPPQNHYVAQAVSPAVSPVLPPPVLPPPAEEPSPPAAPSLVAPPQATPPLAAPPASPPPAQPAGPAPEPVAEPKPVDQAAAAPLAPADSAQTETPPHRPIPTEPASPPQPWSAPATPTPAQPFTLPATDWSTPSSVAPPRVPNRPADHVPVQTPFTAARIDTRIDMPVYQPVPQQRPQGPSHDQLGLIRSAKPLPNGGWRKAVHRLSGGALNPGESSEEATRGALIERINTPVRGDYRIAVLSLKGGVGKTTTTFSLGATFASLRGDRVIAVDANPDFGTLAQRGPDETYSTARDLLRDTDIHRYSDVRRHTSQSVSRLEILASERDPAASELFSEADYRAVMRILQRFYNIILTDCGTGLMHSAMSGVLDEANAIVLVTSPAIDGARSALATLDWLDHHGYSHLVRQSVVAISSSRPGASSVDLEQLSRHFLTRARAVHVVPFDNHLSEGAEISLELVSRKTRMAFMELAAAVADGFSDGGRDRSRG
jgi:MinD-like ATPase involved in chromosome partitioning or flagellar assembly